MIMSNGSMSLAQNPPQSKCHGCGKSVYLQFQDAVMEVLATPQPPHKQTVVWHHDCYDDFLDRGEEC